ncbi:DUF6491 family protein [Asticcacaulis sp. EMRT-3]|uniref:DUF6491 family protein n=1 Tax=Asticcacaulis sp. EMRT-3 TaxID=3040349 RepID=UPI0024AEB22E|nr:DUF6491 family protein [Asticcacaulis sp. EMRT-3]MDI7774292.1 DUF6491 family protein [Asticcacaulis sp. EMRT-3]
MKISAVLASMMITAGGLAAIAGVASAMSAKPDGQGVPPPASHDRFACFDPSFTEGFQTINDHKMIVTTPRNQAYELTLGGVCIGLDTSFTVGIRSRNGMSQVCGPFDADILYNDMGGLRHMQSCPITSVRHLSAEEAAPYVGKLRKAKNDKK